MPKSAGTQADIQTARRKPGWISVIAIYFFYLSGFARTFTEAGEVDSLNLILIQMAIFVILMSLVVWGSRLPTWSVHLLLILQMLLTISMQNMTPDDDFVNILFVLVSFQAALIFEGRILAVWIIVLLLSTSLSLAYSMGFLEGLAKSFSNIAGEVAIFAYFIAVRQTEAARLRQQHSLDELQEVHLRLEEYAVQVEELAAIEERNRLARELHDSVSQTLFSISLNIRTAQIMYRKNASLVKPHLETLSTLAENALAEIRSLITQMRPKS